MKKTKLLVSLAAITTAAITPVITLASCKKDETSTVKAIPESMLDIENNVLNGLKESASIDSYDTLVIPENIVAINKEAFKDVFVEETNASSSIKTIVLNANLVSIGDDAFYGCNSITKLDLSKMQDIKAMALNLGEKSFYGWKDTGGTAVLPDGITDMQKDWIKTLFNNAGLNKSWFGESKPQEQQNVDKVNEIIKEEEPDTFFELVDACSNSGLDVEAMVAEEGHEYVWDQDKDKFFLMNSADGTIAYAPSDYTTINPSKWQLWKMVDETTFKSDCKYSQYLKTPSSNALTKKEYTFCSGFDTGYNTDVTLLQYEYDKSETSVVSKDFIMISTPKTERVNININAFSGSVSEEGDYIEHYGKTCDVNLESNSWYVEYGDVITCTVNGGTVDAEDGTINMTYVKDANVNLLDYDSSVEKVYAKTDAIKAKLQDQGITVAAVKTEAEIISVKEKAHEDAGLPTVTHAFTCSDGTYYDTLSDIAVASTGGNTFEGVTISLNKDYDMTSDCTNWTPIGNNSNYPFKGTLDGQGHSIANFTLTSADNIALITNNTGGKIKNLNFVDCAISSTGGRASLIALFNNGAGLEFTNLKFYNCSAQAVKSNGFAMGYILGVDTTALIENCYTDKNCSATSTASAVVQTGFVSQILADTYVEGEGSGDWVKFKDCEMHLKITSNYAGGSYVGQMGAVGGSYYDDGFKTYSFENCTSYGDVIIVSASGSNGPMAGGFIGVKQHNAPNTGTPVVQSTTTFKNCQNYSHVYATGKYKNIDNLGGFIGYSNNGKISGHTISFEDCVNEGDIGKENESTSYVPNGCGGFVGRTMSDGNVEWIFTRCVNNALIDSSVAGHFIGILGSATAPEKKRCIDCSLGDLAELRDGASRTQITGEPD